MSSNTSCIPQKYRVIISTPLDHNKTPETFEVEEKESFEIDELAIKMSCLMDNVIASQDNERQVLCAFMNQKCTHKQCKKNKNDWEVLGTNSLTQHLFFLNQQVKSSLSLKSYGTLPDLNSCNWEECNNGFYCYSINDMPMLLSLDEEYNYYQLSTNDWKVSGIRFVVTKIPLNEKITKKMKEILIQHTAKLPAIIFFHFQ